jgi:HK97 family phage portal protein
MGRREYGHPSKLQKTVGVHIFPPPIIGDLQYGTFSNVETLLRWFAQNTLSPWIRKVEAEFTRRVFGRSGSHRLEIDLSGLMRGDPAQRWAAWKIAVEANILTPDEVRQEEGWNSKSAVLRYNGVSGGCTP